MRTTLTGKRVEKPCSCREFLMPIEISFLWPSFSPLAPFLASRGIELLFPTTTWLLPLRYDNTLEAFVISRLHSRQRSSKDLMTISRVVVLTISTRVYQTHLIAFRPVTSSSSLRKCYPVAGASISRVFILRQLCKVPLPVRHGYARYYVRNMRVSTI